MRMALSAFVFSLVGLFLFTGSALACQFHGIDQHSEFNQVITDTNNADGDKLTPVINGALSVFEVVASAGADVVEIVPGYAQPVAITYTDYIGDIDFPIDVV